MSKELTESSKSRWSLSRRLLWITLLVVSGHSVISFLINHSLRQHLIDHVLRDTMQRQTALVFDEVKDQLKQFTPNKLQACCTVDDYQTLLSEINLSDGKAALILGKAGTAYSRSSQMLFDESQLQQFAAYALQANDGFVVLDINASEAVALKEVKLPGGPETGNFVYIRPVYGMPLLKSQSILKLGTELILILSTGALLILSTRAPLRTIKQYLSEMDLSNLHGSTLSTDKAPAELLPLLEEFNQMVNRLRQSSSNQKQFAATISHEFRTPLTVTSGFIQSVMSRAKGSLTSQQFKSLEIADHEILRLNRMLSDLLDLSRADNQQLSIRREAFEIIPILNQSLKLAQAAYTNQIVCDLSKLPYLEAVGDPDRLVQCIGNLIGNAVKYSSRDSPIELKVSYGGGEVVISVIDHGPGIPSDQFERIFQRFTRADGVALPNGKSSTGLGLSIVEMLMKAMGGKVSVSSELEVGSCFNLILPLQT